MKWVAAAILAASVGCASSQRETRVAYGYVLHGGGTQNPNNSIGKALQVSRKDDLERFGGASLLLIGGAAAIAGGTAMMMCAGGEFGCFGADPHTFGPQPKMAEGKFAVGFSGFAFLMTGALMAIMAPVWLIISGGPVD